MITPDQRLGRMRESFERDKSVLADDYEYFTAAATLRESIRQNKAERKSAGPSGRQSPEQSGTPSSDKTGD